MSELRTSLFRWVAACTLAEALGITVVSVTYAALDRNLIAPAAPWILLAGAWEGLCLGSAQAFFLRRLRINPALWIGLTIAGAIVGYGLSLLGGAGAEDTGSASGHGGGDGCNPDTGSARPAFRQRMDRGQRDWLDAGHGRDHGRSGIG